MTLVSAASEPGSARETFRIFLRLGLTSFGGPAAHLGYFRAEFVERRRWLSEAAYADLVALCQFLPGPSSSQVGFAIGLGRAGWRGAAAAWLGFTAPSAALMILAGLGAARLRGALALGLVHGLKVAAAAVVAQAVWSMGRSLAAGPLRAMIAAAALVLAGAGGGSGQLAAMAAGAALGGLLIGATPPTGGASRAPLTPAEGAVCLGLFGLLLIGAPLAAAATGDPTLRRLDAFYQSGALVFGGGHVVLPLLQARLVAPGLIGEAPFLSGYALAQALPGPLFTFAAYLGALGRGGPSGVAGGLLALVAIFLPGLLVLCAALPVWSRLKAHPRAAAAIAGTNAAVVGVLGAALVAPIGASAIRSPADLLIAAAGFLALAVGKIAPVWVVGGAALYGLALAR